MSEAIRTSIFELFKIGPGPSSSHTIGPIRAALDFLRECRSLDSAARARADRIEVRLFGSLSATGRGHGTDRAIVAGLLGRAPEECAPEFMASLDERLAAGIVVDLGGASVVFRGGDLVFDRVRHEFPFSNTLVFRLFAGDAMLFERVYYSIGGGFIQCAGRAELPRVEPVYPYENAEGLKELLAQFRIGIDRLVIENEAAITGSSESNILDRLDRVMRVMDEAVERGLRASGTLPGPVGLLRKAGVIFERSSRVVNVVDRFLMRLSAYALAVSEENAAGHLVVTAPTSGAAGLIPGVAYAMQKDLGFDRAAVRRGLLAAAAVGFVAKHNASIAGAEVGCQGEVGVASAMAAAMLATARGFPFTIASNAAEIALEHHLGMTCDPVGGFVQIPCVERNAMGAVKAYNAYLLAGHERPQGHKVDLDRVIAAMRETGRDMSSKYKETGEGGLAVSLADC